MLFVSDLSLLLDASWLLCSGCCCPIAFSAAGDRKRADGGQALLGGAAIARSAFMCGRRGGCKRVMSCICIFALKSFNRNKLSSFEGENDVQIPVRLNQ